MTFVFHTFMLIACMVTKTALFPFVPVFTGFYNPAILYIMWLGLFRPLRESLIVAFLFGFVMDSLSSGPFGLNIIIYFWLYLIVRWLNQFLHGGNFILLALLSAGGVLLENSASIVAVTANAGFSIFHPETLENIGFQLFWASITGPFLIVGFSRMHGAMKILSAEKPESNGKAET